LIIDTNGLSAMADGDPGLAAVLHNPSELAIPVIVLGEYRYGIAISRLRTRYEKWLRGLVLDCRILAVDDRTASEYAVIRGEQRKSGRPIPTNDCWIAALARQHSLPILSRDAHFDLVSGIRRISW
jgi:predicted nucleic acid-binding protein